MDRTNAYRRLPHAHALALRLRDAGADHRTIAGRLDIPPEAVGPLLRLADIKLTELLDRTTTDADQSTNTT